MGFKELFQLLKVKEYYKNLLIYLPLLFVKEFFNLNSFINVTFGFIALCLVSSSYYIINDILDVKKDRYHPEKRLRPLASGKVSTSLAFLISVILLLTSLLIAIQLDIFFTIMVLSLFTLTLTYSSFFKKIFLLDIILISINFILRPLSGVFLIYENSYVRISPWLILVSFFLAFYLSSAKKRANFLYLGKTKYNTNLKHYKKEIIAKLFLVSTSLLILVYSIFTFYSDFPNLFVTIPIVMYAVLYHHEKVEERNKIGREMIYAFKDKQLVFASILWVIVTFGVIYFF